MRLDPAILQIAADVDPCRRVERLLEWVRPVADEIGATPWLKPPERNAAERQIAQRALGATFEEIYAEQVGLAVPARAEPAGS